VALKKGNKKGENFPTIEILIEFDDQTDKLIRIERRWWYGINDLCCGGIKRISFCKQSAATFTLRD
jgi:hypothetical protein